VRPRTDYSVIQQAQELRPDLVVLNVGLPKLNGIEAARVICERSPRSKILFVSQESSGDVIQEAMNTGARGYVTKINVGRDLVPAVGAALRGEIFLNSIYR
jgi:DNA-binding NarL/FixJ family response regulator